MSGTAPANLVIQWRDHNGQSIRSLAYLQGNQSAINIPVNNFVKLSWSAIVPTGVNGLQAVNIEGQPTLLALDASPLKRSAIAGTPATVPVIDAGAAKGSHRHDPLLPVHVMAALGPSPHNGQSGRESRREMRCHYV